MNYLEKICQHTKSGCYIEPGVLEYSFESGTEANMVIGMVFLFLHGFIYG